MKQKYNNVLIIGDTHLPFDIEGYLEFCLSIKERCKCDTVVHIGDLVDNHAISYHEHDPDGWSPAEEMRQVDKKLQDWFVAFPELSICMGNHDRMVDRKSKTVGLPSRAFRPFRDIWNLPKKWKTDFQFEIYGVMYEHGTGYSGDNAHMKACYNNRQSTVIGHTHGNSAIGYVANEKDCIYGMNVGCGIDRHTYAMDYGRDFKKKPIISCGVVTDNGRNPQIFTMQL
jgi:predicted phosphodiesterase